MYSLSSNPRFASFDILITMHNIPFHVANFVSSLFSLNDCKYELAQIVSSSKTCISPKLFVSRIFVTMLSCITSIHPYVLCSVKTRTINL